MSIITRTILLLVLFLTVGIVFGLKYYKASIPAPGEPNVAAAVPISLPKLLDLGANKCIPCKMMKPILDDLKTSQAGKIEVVFIDVWEDQSAGAKYGISSIPTQIFYDASGKELYRHEGFMPKSDILAKWKEFGVELTQMTAEPNGV